MKSFVAASIFCALAFSLTAKGCELSPPEVNLYHAECGKPLPPQFANCKLVPSDCGCSTLECTASGSTEVRSYPLTQEASGVWTCVDNGYYYLVIIDESNQYVSIHNCVRSSATGQILVFALDNSGTLCETSLDSTSSLVYTPVIKRSVSYAPANVVELTSTEYDEYVATCSSALPAQFDASAYKRIVQNEQGDVVLDCSVVDEQFDYVLTLRQDTGLYTCEERGNHYLVIVDQAPAVTVQRIVVSTFNERSVVYGLDSTGHLCNAWYNADNGLVEYTQISHSGGEVPCGCEY